MVNIEEKIVKQMQRGAWRTILRTIAIESGWVVFNSKGHLVRNRAVKPESPQSQTQL